MCWEINESSKESVIVFLWELSRGNSYRIVPTWHDYEWFSRAVRATRASATCHPHHTLLGSWEFLCQVTVCLSTTKIQFVRRRLVCLSTGSPPTLLPVDRRSFRPPLGMTSSFCPSSGHKKICGGEAVKKSKSKIHLYLHHHWCDYWCIHYRHPQRNSDDRRPHH